MIGTVAMIELGDVSGTDADRYFVSDLSEVNSFSPQHLFFFLGDAGQLSVLFGSQGKLPNAILCGWHESMPTRWLMILIQLHWICLHPEN